MKQPTPVFKGECRDGKLSVLHRRAFDEHLRTLDGPIEIIVRRASEKRSLAANRYYWKVVIPLLSEHCGYTPREMHGELKKLFLYDGASRRLTTTGLNRKEFSEYLEDCIRFGAERLGVAIPGAEVVDVA